MDRAAIDRAAEIFCAARLARARIGHLPEDCRPADEADAYAIQEVLNDRLGAAGPSPIAGYKIGCTTAVMQTYMKIAQPSSGGIYAHTVHRETALLRHADFLRPGVECEIAVRLGADLGPEAAPYSRASVAGAVDACMAAIEIVDDRYDDYRSFDTPSLVADDFFNAGCVLAAPVTAWRAVDLAAIEGRMAVNGAAVGVGRGGDVMGHPFEPLAWLANAQAARGRPLRAGQFVLTGSVVETVWLAPGDAVDIAIEGLGTARAVFAAD